MSESIRARQDDIEGIVDERQRDLIEFLKNMNTGSLKRAKALWTLTRVHLSDRKVDWYFNTVIDAGVIEVYTNGGEKQFSFIKEPAREETEGKKIEKRFNVSTMSSELMPEEEPPENFNEKIRELDMSSSNPFTDYANRKNDLKEINDTRANMGLKPISFESYKKRIPKQ